MQQKGRDGGEDGDFEVSFFVIGLVENVPVWHVIPIRGEAIICPYFIVVAEEILGIILKLSPYDL